MSVVESFWKGLLARLPCVLLTRAPGTCEGPVQLHHIAEGSGKRSTFAMAPLCWAHHEGPAGLHPQVGGRGIREFIRLYRLPGESEYGLLIWMMEDLATLLRGRGVLVAGLVMFAPVNPVYMGQRVAPIELHQCFGAADFTISHRGPAEQLWQTYCYRRPM